MSSLLLSPEEVIDHIISFIPCLHDIALAMTCKTMLRLVRYRRIIWTNGNEFCHGYQLEFYKKPIEVDIKLKDPLTWMPAYPPRKINIELFKPNLLVRWLPRAENGYYFNYHLLWQIAFHLLKPSPLSSRYLNLFIDYKDKRYYLTRDNDIIKSNCYLHLGDTVFDLCNSALHLIYEDVDNLKMSLCSDRDRTTFGLIYLEVLSVETIELTEGFEAGDHDYKIFIFPEGTKFLINEEPVELTNLDYHHHNDKRAPETYRIDISSCHGTYPIYVLIKDLEESDLPMDRLSLNN